MNALDHVTAQLQMQTKLFNNATVGFSDDDADRRTGQANHVKWLTGHIVSSRYGMANMLGLAQSEPFPELFANTKGRQDGVTYPSMTELTKDWNAISDKVITKLRSMSDADLAAPAPFDVPTGDGTVKGVFAFLAHHEAYTIGQIAYVRRIVGLEAMKYN